MIEIDPREVLRMGFERACPYHVWRFTPRLIFQDPRTKKDLNTETTESNCDSAQGFKTAFEYIQDYVRFRTQDVAGRVLKNCTGKWSISLLQKTPGVLHFIARNYINHSTSWLLSRLFCSLMLSKNVMSSWRKVMPLTSIYWRRAIPIPMYSPLEKDIKLHEETLQCSSKTNRLWQDRLCYWVSWVVSGWWDRGCGHKAQHIFNFLCWRSWSRGIGSNVIPYCPQSQGFVEQIYNTHHKYVATLQNLEEQLSPHFLSHRDLHPSFTRKPLMLFKASQKSMVLCWV